VSWRSQRIAEQIRAEVARILRDEVSDPRVSMVTLTRVEVAPDLTLAKLFWSVFDPNADAAIEIVAEGLESASAFVRRQLAHCLSLRRTPELSFRHDPTIEWGSETLALLKSLRDDSQA
jgi:ribosome-binding factor A